MGYNLVDVINNGSIPEIEKAIQNGASVNTLLHHALRYNAAIEIIYLLVNKYKADVNATDDSGWTPLMYALKCHADTKATEFLLAKGAKLRLSFSLYLDYDDTFNYMAQRLREIESLIFKKAYELDCKIANMKKKLH